MDLFGQFYKTALIPDAVSLKAFAEFNRNFATLVRAEVPIIQALRTLREHTSSVFLRKALADLEAGVERGTGNLAELMDEHPLVFPYAYRRLIRAGEETGGLDRVLENLADYYEKEVEFRYELTRLLSFPLFQLAIVGVIVGCGSAAANSVVRALGGEGLAFQLFGGPGVALVKILLLTVVLWWLATKIPVLKQILAYVVYSLPFFKNVFWKLSLARFARVFGLATDAGVPLLEAVELACDGSGNPFISSKKWFLVENLSKGESLKDALVAAGLVNSYTASFFAVGEATGTYGDSLSKLSHFLEEEARLALTSAAKLLPIVITLLLGAAVGAIVINFYANYFNLLNSLF